MGDNEEFQRAWLARQLELHEAELIEQLGSQRARLLSEAEQALTQLAVDHDWSFVRTTDGNYKLTWKSDAIERLVTVGMNVNGVISGWNHLWWPVPAARGGHGHESGVTGLAELLMHPEREEIPDA